MTVYTAKLRQGYLQPRRLGDNFAFAPDKLWEIARQKPAFSLDFTKRSIIDQIGGVSGAFTRPASTELAWDGTQFVSYAADQPAWSVGPNGLWGLQMAPGARNEISNSAAAGAAVGTPGTLPTGWGLVTAGLTVGVIAIGTDSGLPFIDLRFSGVTTAVEALVAFEPNTAVVTSSSIVWTAANFIKLISGSLSGVTGVRARTREGTSGGAGTVNTVGSSVIPSGSFQQSVVTVTTNAATQRISSGCLVQFSGIGVAIDITLRIGLPQLELGPVVTPPIITAGAPVTRSADAFAFGPGAAFDSWYNQAGGVWVVASTLPSAPSTVTANRSAFAVHDGTSNNRYNHRAQITGSLDMATFVRSGAAVIADMQRASAVNTSLAVVAANIQTNNFATSLNGLAPLTDALGTLSSSMTTLSVGSIESGNEPINGIIHRLDYYPPGPAANRIQQLSAAVL